MHILIGDSGSTKTDWAYLTENAVQIYTTQGLNPNHLSEIEIQRVLVEELGQHVPLQTIEKVYFYGAGLGSELSKNFLYRVFEKIFLHSQIDIEHDVLGAARAVYSPETQGIICILGTGSIAGYFDGHKIVRTSGGLGYLLGDEGSGTYLGKLLIREYAQEKLPEPLHKALHDYTTIKSTEILPFLYKIPQPNQYLAKLSHFILEHKENQIIKNILFTAFEDFYTCTLSYLLLHYPEHKTIKCVGSIAYLFQNELKTVLQKYNVEINTVIQKPITGLVEKLKT